MQQRRRTRIGLERLGLCVCTTVLAALGGTLAWADDPPPDVGLDQLLKVPDRVHVASERRGGATRSEWRARFEAARAERDDAEAKLAEVRAKLEEKAEDSGSWQMTAPGGAGPAANEAPLHYRLSQEIRHQREEVERAEKRLRELRVEANLAGVPSDWIEPATPSGPDQP